MYKKLAFFKVIQMLHCFLFCFRISYLLQPYVEPPWHVGQREELVQPLGHVLCVDPEVCRPECVDHVGDRDEQA